ncbi:MAG: hypothetical protein IID36_08700 [Planctomycetes bacterium]|nr:hypothetical protein [Planctomycetota bacterium]
MDVFIAGVADLRAYQVAVDAFARNNERLSVGDVVVDTARRDYAFSSRASLPATDTVGSRLGSVLIEGAVDVASPRYLGTFVFDTVGVAAGDTVRVEVRVGEDSFLRNESSDAIDFAVGGPMIVTID